MSARKLGRLAGLVFMLAAVFGGVAAVGAVQHESGEANAAVYATLETSWG